MYEDYELNMFPLHRERMRRALENDTFCSDLEEEVNCFPFADGFQIHMIFMIIGVLYAHLFRTFPFQFLACTVCLEEVSAVLCVSHSYAIFGCKVLFTLWRLDLVNTTILQAAVFPVLWYFGSIKKSIPALFSLNRETTAWDVLVSVATLILCLLVWILGIIH